MSSIDIDQISSASSIDTFAPVAVYRLKYYKPQTLFDNVLYALIRPPRFVYNQKLLVPGRKYQQRFDYEVHNIPFPLSIYWTENPKYIILYLHGNSSSRFEGYLHLKDLPEGACLACFDFKGCGLRKDGKFITLGKEESAQVDTAVDYLKSYGYPIVGWGRSMGAVSLLMSSKCEIMIADSPFASLYDLCKQTSLNFVPAALCCLVHCLFPCLFCCVRSGVQNKSGMDPKELQIIKAVEKQDETKSLLIMAGKQDSMIHYSHAQKLHDAFKGKAKRLILFDGTHNSTRPSEVIDECFEFINCSIQKRSPSTQKIVDPKEFNSEYKVLKIDRQSSKSSLLVNHQTVTVCDNPDLQSSKQTLMMNMKTPIELRPLKVISCKSSPKKMSRIEGDVQFTEETNIKIHQQEDIIRQGIGKFQKNLGIANSQEKVGFKFLSKKNQIQNSEPKLAHLKSIRPIKQITFVQQKIQYLNTKDSMIKKQQMQRKQPKNVIEKQNQLKSFNHPAQVMENSSKICEISQINSSKPKEGKQSVRQTNQKLSKNMLLKEETKIGSQKNGIENISVNEKNIVLKQNKTHPPVQLNLNFKDEDAVSIRELGTPLSQPSRLIVDDVKLLQEEVDSLRDRQSTKQLMTKSIEKDHLILLTQETPEKAKIACQQTIKHQKPALQTSTDAAHIQIDNKDTPDKSGLKKSFNQQNYQLNPAQHVQTVSPDKIQTQTPNKNHNIQFIDL